MNTSTNSRSVSQRCRSTSSRLAQKIAPPKLDKLIREKARNRSSWLTLGLRDSISFMLFRVQIIVINRDLLSTRTPGFESGNVR